MAESNSPFNVRKAKKITDFEDDPESRASNNLPEEKLVSMTFNMPQDWHSRFKIKAALRGISMKELLLECFSLYEQDEQKKRR